MIDTTFIGLVRGYFYVVIAHYPTKSLGKREFYVVTKLGSNHA
ncbi:MAG: hypothetical protein ORN98_10365 [Alphaproteobacteria bacterium]|nr:hypothetical protein [Alphaproteobacteria bacterium]